MAQQHEGKGNFADSPKTASAAGKKGGQANHSKATSKQSSSGNSKSGQKS